MEFSQLSDGVRRDLEQAARIRRFKAGRSVFGSGDSQPGILFLIEGTIRVHQQGDNGRDIVPVRLCEPDG